MIALARVALVLALAAVAARARHRALARADRSRRPPARREPRRRGRLDAVHAPSVRPRGPAARRSATTSSCARRSGRSRSPADRPRLRQRPASARSARPRRTAGSRASSSPAPARGRAGRRPDRRARVRETSRRTGVDHAGRSRASTPSREAARLDPVEPRGQVRSRAHAARARAAGHPPRLEPVGRRQGPAGAAPARGFPGAGSGARLPDFPDPARGPARACSRSCRSRRSRSPARRVRAGAGSCSACPIRPGASALAPLAIASVPLLIALAITQPALRRHGSTRARRRGRLRRRRHVVVDGRGAGRAGPDAARAGEAHRARRGLAARRVSRSASRRFTDRALPNLFPTPIGRSSTRRSASLDDRQPAAARDLAGRDRASPRSRRSQRALLHRARRSTARCSCITDGESRPFDAAALRRRARDVAARARRGRAGRRRRRSPVRSGRAPGSIYRADPGRRSPGRLAARLGDRRPFVRRRRRGVAAALASVLGSGPTRPSRRNPKPALSAPFVVLLAFPLLSSCVLGWHVRASRRLL